MCILLAAGLLLTSGGVETAERAMARGAQWMYRQRAGKASIEAPEEDYGQWFVGKAEPLRRLVKTCA